MAGSLRILRGVGLRAQCVASRWYSTGSGLPLTFSSPTKSFYENVEVNQVDVNSTAGAFGILPNHVPAISVLKPGLISVYESDNKLVKYFASSGTVTVNADGTVQILAEEAAPLEAFDLQNARTELEHCRKEMSTASSDQAKAHAMIGEEFYEALIKALE